MRPLHVLPLVLFGAGGACTAPPYEPGVVVVPRDPASFDVLLIAVREDYPQLVEADRERFRIQSDWLPCDDRGTPGQRRLTIYPDEADGAGTLRVLVEARFLVLPLVGAPYWSTTRGHPYWEGQLVQKIRAATGPG